MKKEKNIEFISEIEYNNKKYAKAIKMEKQKVKYVYYEITDNDELKNVEDTEILEYLKDNYEIKPEKIIY